MAAITWRNVDAPSLGDPSRTMAAATQTFNTAFDGLGKLLQQEESRVDSNWNARKDYNTNTFLDRLAQFSTPEEAQAALASGELAGLRQSMGAQVDGTAVRNAQNSLVENLQRKATSNQTYLDQRLAVEERPIIGQATALMNQGRFAEARDFVANSNLSEQSKATLFGAAQTGERGEVDWQFKLLDRQNKNDEAARQAEMHPLDMAVKRAQANAQNASAYASRASANGGGKPNLGDVAKVLDMRSAPYEAAQKNNLFGGATYDSKEGRTALESLLKDTGTFFLSSGKSVFVDDVIADLKKQDLVSKDGKSFVFKDDSGKEVKVPVSADVIRMGISQSNGMFDPRVGDVSKVLAGYLKSDGAAIAVNDYLNNRYEQEKIRLDGLNAIGGNYQLPSTPARVVAAGAFPAPTLANAGQVYTGGKQGAGAEKKTPNRP